MLTHPEIVVPLDVEAILQIVPHFLTCFYIPKHSYDTFLETHEKYSCTPASMFSNDDARVARASPGIPPFDLHLEPKNFDYRPQPVVVFCSFCVCHALTA